FGIDGNPAWLERILREVEGKAVGIVQREGSFAGKLSAAAEPLASLFQQRKPARECVAKPRLFELERFADQRLGTGELRIGLPHLARERGNEAPHQWLLGAELLGMAHGAAHDAAEHVTAAFVRRKHAVRDEERRGAQM